MIFLDHRHASPPVRSHEFDRINGRCLRGDGDRIALHDFAHGHRIVSLFGVVGSNQVEELTLRNEAHQTVFRILDHHVADILPDHHFGHQVDGLVLVDGDDVGIHTVFYRRVALLPASALFQSGQFPG